MYSEIIEQIKLNAEKANQICEGDYLGEDGLMYCGKCKTRKQKREIILGDEDIVSVNCKCKSMELKRMKEKRNIQKLVDGYFDLKRDKPQAYIEHLIWFNKNRDYVGSEVLVRERKALLKKLCFTYEKMRDNTFENDDGSDEKMTAVMKRYVEKFEQLKKEGRGICLFGDVGVGKSYYAACIANGLIERGEPVLMTNFEWIRNKISDNHGRRQDFIDNLSLYSLIIIDDFGTESESDYMYELVFSVIDSRIRSGLPMVVTTNLTSEELKYPYNIKNKRLYSRLLGACYPIKIQGVDRRREMLKSQKKGMDQLLGIEEM